MRFSSDIVLVVGPPLLLAIVEVFHPHPDDLLKVDVQTWLVVHDVQIVLFPLAALFKTHAWPGGPLTFGGLAVAAAWLERERVRRARRSAIG